MKALCETIGELVYPRQNGYHSPEWKRSDYIVLVVVALLLAVVIGFWP